jgi:acyl-CoA thioesterase-1
MGAIARKQPYLGLAILLGMVTSFLVGSSVRLTPLTLRPTQPIAILPLGDSITQGGRRDRAEYTYRYPLYCTLIQKGYNVDFVGSLNQGLDADATWLDCPTGPFDRNHEGHYGWKTAEIRDRLETWLLQYPYPPDIVLIHLGSNDMDMPSSDYNATIIEPLQDIIQMLRQANPNVVILVGHLNWNNERALQIRPLVEEMARKTSTFTSPVVTVHHYDGWEVNPEAENPDTFDWAHPNRQGQDKMAQRWFDAMQPYLEKLQKE